MYCVPTWHIIIILVSFVTCGVQNRIDCKYCQIKRFVLTFVQVYLYFTNNKNLFSERWGWKCSQLMMLEYKCAILISNWPIGLDSCDEPEALMSQFSRRESYVIGWYGTSTLYESHMIGCVTSNLWWFECRSLPCCEPKLYGDAIFPLKFCVEFETMDNIVVQFKIKKNKKDRKSKIRLNGITGLKIADENVRKISQICLKSDKTVFCNWLK